MYPALRLSRITSPRATLWSIALLVVALGLFGAWASASHAKSHPHSTEIARTYHPVTLDDALHAAISIK